MSTILKALRKLEQDKAGLSPLDPLPIHNTLSSSSGDLNRRNRKRRLSKSLLGVTTVCLILAVSIYFYLQSRDRQAPTMTSEHIVTSSQERDYGPRIDDPKQRFPSVGATNGAAQPAGSPSTPSIESMPADGMSSGQPPSEQLVINTSKRGDKPRPVTPARPAREDIQEQLATKGPPVPTVQAATPRVAETYDKQIKAASAKAPLPIVSPLTENSTTRAYADVALLTDGRMKVNALAWSTIPEKRLAVINSSIVHEKDKVDGFVVVTIEQEAVILREKGGSMWRLVIRQ